MGEYAHRYISVREKNSYNNFWWKMARVDTFKCGHSKAVGNLKNRGDGGFQCRICVQARTKKWHDSHPENLRASRLRRRRKLIESRTKIQKGRCGICEKKLKYPYSDHNHDCCPLASNGCDKCRRGLLCSDCNTKLAALETPGWAEKGNAYLTRWENSFEWLNNKSRKEKQKENKAVRIQQQKSYLLSLKNRAPIVLTRKEAR